jgi:NAD(P)-dependent dehydrogenase (short-subunit alcohol dehydrogenase family)
MGQLDGKVALITGAGSGLGRAMLDLFIAEGARVGVLERSIERAQQVEQDYGPAVAVTAGDVTSLDDNEAAVQRTLQAFGRLDVFVGNAGIFDARLSLEELPKDKISAAFDELFGVDVKGYILGAKACLTELRKSRGSIIFTSSISGLHAGYGGTLYIAAKHAVVGLTKQLAYELAPDIRVNTVAPGYMATQLGGLASLGQLPSKPAGQGPMSGGPLRTSPKLSEFAALYLLLASDNGRTMNGAVLLADSGSAIRGPQPLMGISR